MTWLSTSADAELNARGNFLSSLHGACGRTSRRPRGGSMSRQMLRLRLVGRLTVGLLASRHGAPAGPGRARPHPRSTPTTRSPRHGRPAAATPARWAPRTATSTRPVTGSARTSRGGKIFFTPATGAHIMTGRDPGQVRVAWRSRRQRPRVSPPSTRAPGSAPDSRNTTFSAADNPVIFWTPDTGARVVRGPINAAWDKLGGSSGVLGVPAEDETYDGDRRHAEVHRW